VAFLESWRDFILGAGLVALGFAMSLLGPPITEWIGRRVRRKKIAVMLSSEISTIRATVTYGHEMYTRIMKPFIDAKELEPLATVGFDVNDPDFPTHIYDRVLEDISLFDVDLIVLLTDLYNMVDITHHTKQLNLKASAERDRLLDTMLDKPGSDEHRWWLRNAEEAALMYAKGYVACLEKVESLSGEALKELNKIKPYEPKRKPTIRMDKPLKYEI